MNERLKTHSKTQKKSADLVSNKLRIGVFQRYQMKCKSVSKKSPRYMMDGRLRWQGQEWCIVKAPWMIKSGMMLRLRSDGGKRQHLWLAADSMDEAEWRDLRRILLQQETQR
ncbi:hypothetical protein CHH13_001447 [Escherichia coli]|nr:hypothetical protein [Escherichia coli]